MKDKYISYSFMANITYFFQYIGLLIQDSINFNINAKAERVFSTEDFHVYKEESGACRLVPNITGGREILKNNIKNFELKKFFQNICAEGSKIDGWKQGKIGDIYHIPIGHFANFNTLVKLNIKTGEISINSDKYPISIEDSCKLITLIMKGNNLGHYKNIPELGTLIDSMVKNLKDSNASYADLENSIQRLTKYPEDSLVHFHDLKRSALYLFRLNNIVRALDAQLLSLQEHNADTSQVYNALFCNYMKIKYLIFYIPYSATSQATLLKFINSELDCINNNKGALGGNSKFIQAIQRDYQHFLEIVNNEAAFKISSDPIDNNIDCLGVNFLNLLDASDTVENPGVTRLKLQDTSYKETLDDARIQDLQSMLRRNNISQSNSDASGSYIRQIIKRLYSIDDTMNSADNNAIYALILHSMQPYGSPLRIFFNINKPEKISSTNMSMNRLNTVYKFVQSMNYSAEIFYSIDNSFEYIKILQNNTHKIDKHSALLYSALENATTLETHKQIAEEEVNLCRELKECLANVNRLPPAVTSPDASQNTESIEEVLGHTQDREK